MITWPSAHEMRGLAPRAALVMACRQRMGQSSIEHLTFPFPSRYFSSQRVLMLLSTPSEIPCLTSISRSNTRFAHSTQRFTRPKANVSRRLKFFSAGKPSLGAIITEEKSFEEFCWPSGYRSQVRRRTPRWRRARASSASPPRRKQAGPDRTATHMRRMVGAKQRIHLLREHGISLMM